MGENMLIGVTEFVERSIKLHGNVYDYSKVDYLHGETGVEIICTKHGSFIQTPKDHLDGCGCKRCSMNGVSKGETEISDFIRYNYSGKIITNDRELLEGLELDVYLPDENLAIEFNGFTWHSFQRPLSSMGGVKGDAKFDGFMKKKMVDGCKWGISPAYHQNKFNKCMGKGVRLIQIWDYLWNTHSHHYKDMILNALGVNSEVIYARKCDVVAVDRSEYFDFIKNRSFHGGMSVPKNSEIWGLEYNGDLVMVCDYNKKTCNRMISELGVRVVGGVSRLLKDAPLGMTYFTTNDSGSIIKKLPRFTKVDYDKRRGFLVKKIAGGYSILKDSWVRNPQTKKILGDKWNEKLIEPNKQWNELVRNGWYYIADSGLTKFIKTS
jgi:hypothetical protein